MKSIVARRVAAVGATLLLAAAVFATVSGSTQISQTRGQAVLTASDDFSLEVFGSYGSSVPNKPDWEPAETDPIALSFPTENTGFIPGSDYVFVLGARNISAGLSGDFSVSLKDLKPNERTLFDSLTYSIRKDGVVLVGPVTSEELFAFENVSIGSLESGEEVTFELVTHYPRNVSSDTYDLDVDFEIRIDGANT